MICFITKLKGIVDLVFFFYFLTTSFKYSYIVAQPVVHLSGKSEVRNSVVKSQVTCTFNRN